MTHPLFDVFFQNEARARLLEAVDLALAEDGPDPTSDALFPDPADMLSARIISRQETILAGLPLLSLILGRMPHPGQWTITLHASEGRRVAPDIAVAEIRGSAALLLRAERPLLNFLCHLSGVANLTSRFVQALQGSPTRLLDTRKTLPGLRYPEKYAVLLGGGLNHRRNLGELLMLKDNHIDQAGSITHAVQRLRHAYSPCPPIAVECRTIAHVHEAVACRVNRIMLDNMSLETLRLALPLIPKPIESEITGGVTLDTLGPLGRLGADYVSVGRITHSAPAADFTMLLNGDTISPKQDTP